MDLAVLLGRTPELAHKETEAVASILPLQWTASMLQPGVVRLKQESGESSFEVKELRSLSQKDSEFTAALRMMQARLGGVMKIVALVGRCERTSLEADLVKLLADVAGGWSGKFSFGLSALSDLNLQRLSISLKKALQQQGHSVRAVEPREKRGLGSAQVFHNRLYLLAETPKGVEAVLIPDGSGWLVGLTLTVQDVDAYGERDFKIPYPDPVSGMLPPKLAQTLINLAAGAGNGAKTAVYDPFCGNGRVVLEAALMGFTSYGSDIDPKKVASAQANYEWLIARFGVSNRDSHGAIWWQDATVGPKDLFKAVDNEGVAEEFVIASEPFLGKPLRAALKPSEKAAWLGELVPLYSDFLAAWAATDRRPKRMVLVFPAARTTDGTRAATYDALVDRMKQIGYSSTRLGSYARPDAFVVRDIVQIEYSK